jgi:hypothetical protein
MHAAQSNDPTGAAVVGSPAATEWALGLFRYREALDVAPLFARFHELMPQVLRSMGLACTHIAIDGPGHSGKLVKASSVVVKRAVQSGFQGISSLAFAACSPANSGQPAYDLILSADLTWIESLQEMLLCLTVNEAVMRFRGDAYWSAVSTLASMDEWDFGFSLCDLATRQPGFHVLSLDNGRLGSAEYARLTKWYSAAPAQRIHRLRDVYPVNLLGGAQLSSDAGGQKLADLIESVPHSTTTRVGSLTAWCVQDEQLQQVRKTLGEAGILIAG